MTQTYSFLPEIRLAYPIRAAVEPIVWHTNRNRVVCIFVLGDPLEYPHRIDSAHTYEASQTAPKTSIA